MQTLEYNLDCPSTTTTTTTTSSTLNLIRAAVKGLYIYEPTKLAFITLTHKFGWKKVGGWLPPPIFSVPASGSKTFMATHVSTTVIKAEKVVKFIDEVSIW